MVKWFNHNGKMVLFKLILRYYLYIIPELALVFRKLYTGCYQLHFMTKQKLKVEGKKLQLI